MEARHLELEDHETLSKWWIDNRWQPVGLDDLPMVNNELQGVMVSKDGVEICAGFLINTTVKNGAMVEYIVSNFDVKDRPLRKEALIYLIDRLCMLAKSMGKKYVFTSVKNKGLIDRYKDCDFTTGSTDTVEMIKAL